MHTRFESRSRKKKKKPHKNKNNKTISLEGKSRPKEGMRLKGQGAMNSSQVMGEREGRGRGACRDMAGAR